MLMNMGLQLLMGAPKKYAPNSFAVFSAIVQNFNAKFYVCT